ncbi:MogA/MoaB family molybdenum cofactor biosynthesis protein [Halodesulfurarchaeum sp.]|uniref:MogA/MoaB family molybdenum cofactor biosynthesis protein n=1 Tax=Halodesulfurarchaeum sp. TaxID=1980530 RepID=UPI001BBAE06E|nr:MogA/MoaB family molybdenum cofactor biosynthesis protein [Halodesulfurarchaeum sp.]
MVDFQQRDTHRDEDESENDDRDEQEETEPTAEETKHDHHAQDLESVGAAVLTVSSSRTLDADPSGDAIRDAFESKGHRVVTRELVGDDFDRIQAIADQLVERRDVDVLVSTGGTGVTPDDVTVDAIGPLFDKHLPGFGEFFRRESAADIGSKVIASRATGGIAHGVPIFVLPGSEDAVTLAMESIILPEIGHLAGLARHED